MKSAALSGPPGPRTRLPRLAGLALLLASCQPPTPDTCLGYVEADYIRIAAPVPGTLLQLLVQRGQAVTTAQPLFVLESAAEQASLQETDRRVSQSEARLLNLRKGRRPTEIASLEARVEQARATLGLWETELARREKLMADRVIAGTELDQTRSQRDAHRALLEAASAELATAQLGARDDEVRAAEADLAAAKAALARAQWAVDQKSQSAPVTATVHDTHYRPGEFVPAGQPVLTLLPPENLKLRFFVPEPQLSRFPIGATVEGRFDGTNPPVLARVSYRSTQPEFTPPVIYSRDQRDRLVYRVEASLAADVSGRLAPGQPVDVRPAAAP